MAEDRYTKITNAAFPNGIPEDFKFLGRDVAVWLKDSSVGKANNLSLDACEDIVAALLKKNIEAYKKKSKKNSPVEQG